ncbi:MAG: diguanylate cyclase [Actinomycetota bacterium]|jgi:diguanylate cyclase (GGDEF)-like protein/PAS domain S-box-containing protein|nr:diguanylate cyclase [Actinomycetota bacterium]
MAAALWSREELRELVRGQFVLMRDASAANLPVPTWLADASLGVIDTDSADSIAATYPADRPLLIDLFGRSLEQPGELLSARLRMKAGDHWLHTEITWLNLLGTDDLDGIVCMVRPVDGPPITPPEEADAGDHDATHWMVMTLADSGLIASVEGRLRDMLGYEPDEVVGHRPTEFLPVESASDSVKLWLELRTRPGNVNTSRRPWLRKDGTSIWLEASYLNREQEGDAPVTAVVWDITERMAQEQALRQREAEVRALAEDFRLLADEVPAAVFRCTADGTVEFHNARWAELLPGSDGITRLHDLVAASDWPVLTDMLWRLAVAPRTEQRTAELRGSDGTSTWRLSLRSMGEVQAGPRSFVGSLSEVSDTLKLRREARQDPLTGLLNRQGLTEQLQQALSGDPSRTVVLFIDLDEFKAVNDTFGHDTGDTVLREVARRLATGLRPDDMLARYGGDEFVAMCTVSGTANADAIRERLILALGGPIELEDGRWQPRASIGAARPEPGDTPASLVRRADLAMFEVKRALSSSYQDTESNC